MELHFDFDDRQGVTSVRFEGLSGTEGVTSVAQALDLMKVLNPATSFAEDVYALKYNDVTGAEYARMLDTVKLLNSIWRYPGEPEEAPPQYQMNVLMLLANAIELVCKLNTELQDHLGKA